MAKGKKYDAAQKHFESKRVAIKKNRHLLDMVCELKAENRQIKSERDALQMENQQLKDWIDRLLEYTELSKEDIAAACEKDKKMKESADMMLSLFKMTGFGFDL